MAKTAFITGITGQDGSYLARLLLKKGYEVHGLKRRSSSSNTERIDQIEHETCSKGRFFTHFGDLTDTNSLLKILKDIRPDELYNLGAQSHVQVSFEVPEYTADVNAMGTLRLLETLRTLNLQEKTRFYQASTSELYGKVLENPQKETTPFNPQSPYAISKLFAYWSTVHYREACNMFACNGILFNHESPLRGENFVTRKITRAAVQIKNGSSNPLRIGNLESRRDWGHAADYVEGMWLMLQQDLPDDYILAMGQVHSVRDFIEIVFRKLDFEIIWEGSGIDEKGIDSKSGKVLIEVDPQYFRPAEVDWLCGDASKARKILNWSPKYSFDDLVDDMIQYDLALK